MIYSLENDGWSVHISEELGDPIPNANYVNYQLCLFVDCVLSVLRCVYLPSVRVLAL